MGKNDKSAITNSILNMTKTLVTYAFPVLTYMYVSRIFLSEGMGILNFSSSYVTYFSLVGMLGIEKYGIREIAKVRDDVKKRSEKSIELLCLNAISIFLAYALFGITLLTVDALHSYLLFLFINSFSILFTGIGMNWLYMAMEDYKYITIRSVIVNTLSFIAVFIFVHEPKDIYVYAVIQVFASSGSNIFNFIHSRKYIDYFHCTKGHLMQHVKPVLVIFGMTLFIEVFTHLDVTMLGFISGDKATGLYSSAHKVSGIMSTLITAAAMVMMPRISYWVEKQDMKQIESISRDVINLILMFSIPIAIGVFLFSGQCIEILSGAEFADASITLKILAFRILFSSLNAFIVLILFIPLGKEKNNIISTGIAAVANFCLNMILIPCYMQNGAAFATVIAEVVELSINLYFLSQIFHLKIFFDKLWEYILGSLIVVISFVLLEFTSINEFILLFLALIISIPCYLGILCLLRNKYILNIVHMIAKREGDI